jgi:hypothetical protein
VSGSDDLERRLCALEDMAQINNLMSDYCWFADRGWERTAAERGAGVAQLFTPEGVWHGGLGLKEGRAAIQAHFDFGNSSLSIHMAMTPYVAVNGDNAIGSWRGLFTLTLPDNRAVWAGNGYRNEFTRTAEGWRLRYMSTVNAFTAQYEQSWQTRTSLRPLQSDARPA